VKWLLQLFFKKTNYRSKKKKTKNRIKSHRCTPCHHEVAAIIQMGSEKLHGREEHVIYANHMQASHGC
jgi:deoxycytidylate deaminase